MDTIVRLDWEEPNYFLTCDFSKDPNAVDKALKSQGFWASAHCTYLLLYY